VKSRLCSLKQVQLSSVKGTGPDGRILKADIEDYLGELLVSSCNH